MVTHGREPTLSGSGIGTFSNYTYVMPIRTLPDSKSIAVAATLGAPTWPREGLVVPDRPQMRTDHNVEICEGRKLHKGFKRNLPHFK